MHWLGTESELESEIWLGVSLGRVLDQQLEVSLGQVLDQQLEVSLGLASNFTNRGPSSINLHKTHMDFT